jgi:hypothetical protein
MEVLGSMIGVSEELLDKVKVRRPVSYNERWTMNKKDK